MKRYLITTAILALLRTPLVAGEPDLQQQNHHDLNPLDQEPNQPSKAQEKRTIFSPTIKNYAWAKHVGIRPSGTKYLLGYSPVDLKYRPVLRPLSQGYHYDRPKLHFQLRKPIVHIPQVKPAFQTDWKPIVKPVVPVHVPPPAHLLTKPARPVLHVDHAQVPHVDHVHAQVPHVDHVHAQVPHLDHVHAQVPHLDLVHAQVPHADLVHAQVPHVDLVHAQVPHVDLVHAQVPHVDHVHAQVPHSDHVHAQVPHVDHVHKVPQLVHVHPAPVAHVDHVYQVPVAPVPQQVPWQHVQVVPQPQQQFLPSAQLFEVTKPDLGVLPLGAVFQAPVLRDVPAPQFKPAVVHQQVVPAQHIQPVTHLHPVVPQPAAAVPGIGHQVEYHGTTNFINLRGQVAGPAVHNLLPDHYHLQYPQIQQQQQQVVPDYQVPRPAVFQQQPEPVQVVHPGSTGVFPQQQQVPLNTQAHFQNSGYYPEQQQLPLEGAQAGTDSQHVFPQQQFQDGGQDGYQQQLPQAQSAQNSFQSDNDVQSVSQQQGRYQPASEVSTVQYYRPGQFQIGDQGYFYQRPEKEEEARGIQPGETDLQLPLHLPQHPGFSGTARQFQQEESGGDSQGSNGEFRPSIQLEPPYEKK